MPDNLVRTWKTFIKNLPHLEQVRISRFINLYNVVAIQLRSFCDASRQGYSAFLFFYLRIIDNNSVPKTHI